MVRRHSTALRTPPWYVLTAVCLVALGSWVARADVIPEEEAACSGSHRAGDACTDLDKEGSCQPSKCLEVDPSSPRGVLRKKERKMREVPCLKCVPTRIQQKPRGLCSIAYPPAVAHGLPLGLLAVAAVIRLIEVRRRRRLSNPLQRMVGRRRPPTA